MGRSLCLLGSARGVCVQPSFGSFIATVVEAEVDDDGEVQLRRVTSAVDTGIAVNPDTIVAQLQGGLIFGLTAALYRRDHDRQGAACNNPTSTITACCASMRCRRSTCTSSRAARTRAASAKPDARRVRPRCATHLCGDRRRLTPAADRPRRFGGQEEGVSRHAARRHRRHCCRCRDRVGRDRLEGVQPGTDGICRWRHGRAVGLSRRRSDRRSRRTRQRQPSQTR